MLEEEELKDAALLVFANKQDLPKALSAAQISEALGLGLLKDRTFQICASVATTGQGLKEGLDWVAEAVKK